MSATNIAAEVAVAAQAANESESVKAIATTEKVILQNCSLIVNQFGPQLCFTNPIMGMKQNKETLEFEQVPVKQIGNITFKPMRKLLHQYDEFTMLQSMVRAKQAEEEKPVTGVSDSIVVMLLQGATIIAERQLFEAGEIYENTTFSRKSYETRFVSIKLTDKAVSRIEQMIEKMMF